MLDILEIFGGVVEFFTGVTEVTGSVVETIGSGIGEVIGSDAAMNVLGVVVDVGVDIADAGKKYQGKDTTL
jgi:hypothetical protein